MEKTETYNDNLIENEDISSVETITTPFSPGDITLSTPPMNLGDLIDMIDAGWIVFDTDYQREGNLWDDTKQSRLIESVLLGLRLPAFYFEEVEKRKWNIIDGLQRCCAIKNFCINNSLRLKNLEFLSEQFGNKNYSDLSFETTRDIRMLPITVNLLDKGTPDPVKYILFKRLNTGGINLTLQEVRNAMFQGKVVNTLKEMAQDEKFLEATEHKIPTKRKEDLDFISRFTTFYLLDYKEYQPDLESYINKSMKMLRDELSDEQIESMKKDFNKAMTIAFEIFGNDAFRRRYDENASRNPINKAYFEVISTTFARLTDFEQERLIQNKDLLKQNLLVFMKNDIYQSSFSGGTATKDSVTKRFGGFNEIIRRTVNNHKIAINNDNKIENSEL